MNFTEYLNHFSEIYGRNNAVYITSLQERMALLSLMVTRLQNSLRKKDSQIVVKSRIANALSRAFAVADHFKELPLDSAIATKYPKNGCGYCNKIPCECDNDSRQSHHESNVCEYVWEMSALQLHLKKLYGENNSRLGIENILNRLTAEISEVTELLMDIEYVGKTAEEVQWQYALEIADIFAWILGAATILNIDTESVISELYGNGCPACDQKVCQCQKFLIVDGKITHSLSA